MNKKDIKNLDADITILLEKLAKDVNKITGKYGHAFQIIVLSNIITKIMAPLELKDVIMICEMEKWRVMTAAQKIAERSNRFFYGRMNDFDEMPGSDGR